MNWREFFVQTKTKLVKDKRTYAVALAMIVIGVLEAFGIWAPPEWVWVILSGMGLGYLRAGVKKIGEAIQPPKIT
jgi:hypothetical protein